MGFAPTQEKDPVSKPRTQRRGLSRLWRKKDGATAVEFALIAGPFFFILFATAEVSLMYITQSALDMAVMDTQRLVRTGEAQTTGINQAGLQTRLCQRFTAFLPATCAGNLFLDVDRYSSFSDVNDLNPVTNGDLDPARLGYDPGAATDVVLVRAFYRWSILTPGLQAVLANLPGSQRLLTSAALFRTEPYLVPAPNNGNGNGNGNGGPGR